jgi:hypothetical protein
MEEGQVRWVHAVFFHLQPVARPDIAGDSHELVARQVKGVEDGEIRLLVRWSHVGEQQSIILKHWIGTMTEAFFQRAVRRFPWRLEDLAVDVN